MIFGVASSPCSAQEVKNRNAREFAKTEFPCVVDAIIDSLDTEDEAICQIHDVIEVHQQGGFEIRNGISNSRRVLQSITEICVRRVCR